MLSENIGRRAAIKTIVLSVVSVGMARFLAACGGTRVPLPGNPGTNGSSCTTQGPVASVPSDTLHMLTVSKDDVSAGSQKEYHIQGQENHDHTVTLSDEDFKKLQSGQGIQLTSSVTLGHTHQVFVSCP